ncbi:tRNA pseudouridine(55) synthase TruB [Opitutia bacterium KCR 482]|nr:tRNA pseudouridine(55) synthase TruB [Opitutae bacterium KCR 482]MDY5583293.1 tRNA pseudouridine(55) synthase TruB [Candidatus Merdousia sp.]
MEKAGSEYEGILLIDKDAGCTSHDVVNKVRRILKIRSVGHAGTLDPLATGLLVILVGRATKVSQYLMSLDKVYDGEMKLGVETNSQDSEGEVVSELPVPESVNEAYMREQMASFLGDQYQTPPMFSAKKLNGIPLYKLARQGQEVQREPRFINISKFELLEWNKPAAKFRLACSKGTYVRTVCHDLGKKIGCGAHMTQLRRISSDKFNVENAITVEKLSQLSPSAIKKILIPVASAVPSFAL